MCGSICWRRMFIVAIILVLPLWAQSQKYTLQDQPSLADYAKVMLAENPAVRSAHARWQAELRKIALVKGLPDPSVNFGYFIENIETAVGPQEYKLGFRQMIPWPGKLVVQGQIQSKKAQAAYQALQAEIQGRLLALTRMYYDAYFLERSIAITRQHLELVRQWEAVSLTRYRSAKAKHMHLVKAQIETIKLEDDLATLEARRQPLAVAFGVLLNRPQLAGIAVPDSLAYPSSSLNKSTVIEQIKNHNPALARMKAVEATALKSVSRAKMNYLPDVGLGIDRIFTGEKFTIAGDPVTDSGKDPWIVSASVSIPLWFGKQKASVVAAREAALSAGFNAQEKENALMTELEWIWFQYIDAQRKLRLYGDVLIPKARESLDVSEAAYVSGEADFMNLIDAQRRLLQFTLANEKALVHYAQSRAGIAALTGSLAACRT